MKKSVIIASLLFLLGLGIAFSASDSNKVDEEVENLLKQLDKVSVIVVLEDDYDALNEYSASVLSKKNIFEKRGMMIKSQQNRVLNKLNFESKIGIIETKNNEIDFKLRRKFTLVNGFSGEITKKGMEILRNDPNVRKIYPNRAVKAFLSESAEIVNATNTWRLIYNGTNLTGKGESVCIIDTGVDYTHTDLGGCAITDNINDGSCAKVIGGYDFVNSDEDPMDDNGHGTHVAGIVASNNEIYTGIAPDANIVAIKSLDSGGNGYTGDVISGIDWCINNADAFNITVISMSLGTKGLLYPEHCDDSYLGTAAAVDAAIAKNISVIAAAGNEGSADRIASPACIKNVTSVGAVNENDEIVYNRNNITDLFAPGISITSLENGGGTTSKSGTSMSTPHVAAAFALVAQYLKLAENRDAIPNEAESCLKDTGKQIYDSETGLTFPRINIFGAILSLDKTAPVMTIADPTPENNTNTTDTSIFINVNSDEALENALLEWNGTNETMPGSGQNWHINKTAFGTGTYFYKVYGNDFAGNTGETETRQIFVNNSAVCVDADNDTYYKYDEFECPMGNDCDDDNFLINPGASEVCDGIDNNCNDEIDENLIQSCGSGNCEGTRTCIAGEWSDCDSYENDAGICAICDADGNEAYDGTQDADCNDGLYCNGEEECLGINECTDPEDIDCSYLDDQCSQGVCNEDNDNCETQAANESLSCDDGLFCTIDDQCDDGVCSGDVRDCGDGVSCTVDSCDEVNDIIVHTANDSLCDDDVDCTDDTCDAVNDCQYTANDTNCDNGLFCDGEEYCDAVLDCQDGTEINCSTNDLAEIAACDDDSDDNPFTLDFATGFTSTCDEENDQCTTGLYVYIHTCDKNQCNAECESDGDCQATDCEYLDGCYNGAYRQYNETPNACLNNCSCTNNTCTAYSEIITDNDGDGYDAECDNDCDDNNATINPEAEEICDGVDNNCDGIIDEGFADSDDDGLADCIDTDGDNDGYDDDVDNIIGTSDNINSSLNLTAEINGTTNLGNCEGKVSVVIKENGVVLVEFNYNFTNETKLDFSNISYEKNINNDTGSVIISGITLPERETKTLYVDNVNNLTTLCIKDAEITSISQISSLCNGADEYGIKCPGTADNDKYNCTFTDETNSTFKITGLDHSGIQQQSYCGDGACNSGESCSSCPADCGTCSQPPTTTAGGSGGGGGGGRSSAYTCNMDWECGEWSACDGKWQTRECSFVKVPQHTSKEECPTISKVPAMARKCRVKEETVEEEFEELKDEEFEEEETAAENVVDAAKEQKSGLEAITGKLIGILDNNPAFGIIILTLIVFLGINLYYRFYKKGQLHKPVCKRKK